MPRRVDSACRAERSARRARARSAARRQSQAFREMAIGVAPAARDCHADQAGALDPMPMIFWCRPLAGRHKYLPVQKLRTIGRGTPTKRPSVTMLWLWPIISQTLLPEGDHMFTQWVGPCAAVVLTVAGAARADVILEWNDAYLEAIRQTGPAPGPASRVGAIVHVAIYEAVNSIDRTCQPYL